MKGWVIAASIVGGAVVLVWLGKRAMAAQANRPAPGPSAVTTTTPAPSASSGAPQMYVPVYVNGAPQGTSVLWTSTPEQAQLVGPRYPDYYDQDYDKFIFLNQGGGYSWVTIDQATGMIVDTGSSTGTPPSRLAPAA